MTALNARNAVTVARSLLFVPGDRPERFDKAVTSSADGVILDLEDAVAAPNKDAARSHVAEWLAGGRPAAVRINAVDTPWFSDDVAALAGFGCAVMLPKASVDGLAAVAARRGEQSGVIALLETAAGILGAPSICAFPTVIRAAFGSIDLSTELGVDPDDREAFVHARSLLVLGSAAAGIAAPLDGVTTDLTSVARVRADAEYAARMGFTGKLCIHPTQTGPVNAAFQPGPEQVEWARAVVAGAAGGATKVDGHMVDAPVLQRARRLLRGRESLDGTTTIEERI
jgi:citrate lyase subunit beta/citryl-CoA lyase